MSLQLPLTSPLSIRFQPSFDLFTSFDMSLRWSLTLTSLDHPFNLVKSSDMSFQLSLTSTNMPLQLSITPSPQLSLNIYLTWSLCSTCLSNGHLAHLHI